ncbi:MAG: hypothetical protein IH977_07620 [Nitrospinae bacterium]|nr:hypothetical protein [Nitrospinota bacterium]
MARMSIAEWTDGSAMPDVWWSFSRRHEGMSQGVETFRSHRGQLSVPSKCANCGSDVRIHISPKRNPHSRNLGKMVTLKDHDLCRRCWRQLIRASREVLLAQPPAGGRAEISPKVV